MLKRLIQWLSDRKPKPVSIRDYREINRLIIKAARRCAYDLRHAAVGQIDSREGDLYHDRANMWLGIFDMADDGKSYRDGLHDEIGRLNRHIEKYEKYFKDNGLPDPIEPQKIPF